MCADATEHVVCQSKYFRAKCDADNELVLVRRARYGRMNLSKCVRENFGYRGTVRSIAEEAGANGRR